MHLIYCGACVLGCIVQEFSLYRQSILYKIPLSPSCIHNGSCLLFTFLLGFILDFFAIIFLPLLTYIIICSTHLVFFNIYHAHEQGTPLSSSEKIGNLCVFMSTLIISISGGTQGDFIPIIPDSPFLIFALISIFITLTIRRLNFYSGKILLETSIPAQLSVISIGVVKMGSFVLQSDVTHDFSVHFVYPCLLFLLILVGISSSLIRIFNKQHDMIVVYGGYQLWSLLWGVVIGFGFISYAVTYSVIDIACVATAVFLALFGIFIITYQRVEDVKASVDNKNTVLPPRPSRLEDEAPLPGGPSNLELNIDDESLMDAEIIDEDLLIKTIRNLY